MLLDMSDGRQTVLGTAEANYQGTFVRQIGKGLEKYGVALTTFNGRSAAKDAIEELVDLSVYLTQLQMEHTAYREILSCLIHDIPGIVLPKAVVDSLDSDEAQVSYYRVKWGMNERTKITNCD